MLNTIVGTIPLHENSREWIDNEFFKGFNHDNTYTAGTYKEVCESECKRLIIHMYPEKDTYNIDSGELYGFSDSLFFRTIIYNTDNLKYYDYSLHDEIRLEVEHQIRIFKDGSTMIIINQPCIIGCGMSFAVYKI